MEKMTFKEFKSESNIEIIESIMKANNGYVTSKQLFCSNKLQFV